MVAAEAVQQLQGQRCDLLLADMNRSIFQIIEDLSPLFPCVAPGGYVGWVAFAMLRDLTQ